MSERGSSFGPVPEWEDLGAEPAFTEKATAVDSRTTEQFQKDWENHKADLAKIKNPEMQSSEFQKAVKSIPTTIPEAWMTPEERDEHFGSHPLTRHEMEELDKRAN